MRLALTSPLGDTYTTHAGDVHSSAAKVRLHGRAQVHQSIVARGYDTIKNDGYDKTEVCGDAMQDNTNSAQLLARCPNRDSRNGKTIRKNSRVPCASLGAHQDTRGVNTRPAAPQTFEVAREAHVDMMARCRSEPSDAALQAPGTQQASGINCVDVMVSVRRKEQPEEVLGKPATERKIKPSLSSTSSGASPHGAHGASVR